jgi:Tol biopolymer transport system component
MVVGLTLSCRRPTGPEFQRNPNLRLLVSHIEENRACFSPVWSPDGNKIYYLLTPYRKMPMEAGGQLYAIDVDGSNDRLILDGEFGSLAISPSGDMLALTCNATAVEGGALITTDTAGQNIDTIVTTKKRVFDVEFNSDGKRLIYFIYCPPESLNFNGFYSYDLEAGIEEKLFFLQATGGFDISDDDTLLFADWMWSRLYNLSDTTYVLYDFSLSWPQFYGNYVITSIVDGSGELYLVNIENGEYVIIDSQPYENTGSFQPYWSPDGAQLVFSSSMLLGDPWKPYYYELWILEDVWE